MCRSRRKCACRRELNSRDAAKPQISFGSGRWLEAASPMDGTDQIEQPDFSQGRRERRPVQTHEDAARGGEMGSAASLRQQCQRSDEWKNRSTQDERPELLQGIKAKNARLWSALQGAERHARFLARAADAGTATALAVARGGKQNGPPADTAFPSCRAH